VTVSKNISDIALNTCGHRGTYEASDCLDLLPPPATEAKVNGKLHRQEPYLSIFGVYRTDEEEEDPTGSEDGSGSAPRHLQALPSAWKRLLQLPDVSQQRLSLKDLRSLSDKM
jgi:hypothetical protein